ncbi:spore-associated protein A [Spirillospora sp. CA-108201]
MRKSTQRAVLALSAGTVVAGSTFIASPAMAASTPIGACGGGNYHEVDRHNFKKSGKKVATIYLMYNGKTNCVVTWKTHPNSKYVAAGVQKLGDSKFKWEGGYYSTYAGPVKRSARGACITWGGRYDNLAYWTDRWGHCGG